MLSRFAKVLKQVLDQERKKKWTGKKSSMCNETKGAVN